jgi:mRNA interferase MazF
MTSYKFGDIVLVPFPFTDQTTTKKRPAIIVSSEAYQDKKLDLILMAVTSRSKPTLAFGEVRVDEWQKAGLLKPSVIKPVLTTVEKALIVKKLGRLEEHDRENLQNAIQDILG